METMKIPYNLVENGVAPYRASTGAAGYDLHIRSISNSMFHPNMVKCALGVRFAIPDGYVGKLHLRSGLSAMGYILANGVGVIDSDYRGEVVAMILNTYQGSPCLKIGERVAQILFEMLKPVYLEYAFDLGVTDRGEGGFGSTGK